MNLKLKSIAAAVALAVSGQAFAAISNDPGQNGSGELFLSVWDQGTASVPGKSYVLDLGVSMSAVLANPSSLLSIGGDGSVEADAALTSFLATTSGPVVWTIGGISNSQADIYSTYGVGFTTTQTPDTAGNGNVPSGFTGIGAAIQNGGLYVNAVNNAGADPSNFAVNTSYVVTNTGSDAYHGSPLFSGAPGDWGGFFALDVDTAIGTAAQFYYVSLLDGDPNGEGSDILTSNVNFQLGLDGTLTASPVPLPAAAWLLGSGLIGLFGIGRRKAV